MRQPTVIRTSNGLIDEGSSKPRPLQQALGQSTLESPSRYHGVPASQAILQDRINQLETHFEALQSRCGLALEELTGLKRKLSAPENESRKRAKTNVGTRLLTPTDVRDMVKEEEAAEQESKATSQDAEREHGPFTGALSSKTKTGLLHVAQALQLTTTGTKRELLERIRAYLIAHPEKRVDSTFAGLFISRRPTKDENPPMKPSAAPSQPYPPNPGPSTGTYHNPLPIPTFSAPYNYPLPNIYPFYNYFGSHYNYC